MVKLDTIGWKRTSFWLWLEISSMCKRISWYDDDNLDEFFFSFDSNLVNWTHDCGMPRIDGNA